MKLEEKVAIVTGGARGMGRSHCLALAREGANIVTCDICGTLPVEWPLGTKEELDETVSQVNKSGGKAVGLVADISKADEVKAVVDETIGQFGRVDILVNNAAVDFHYGACHEVTEEQWDIMIDVNLKGSWLCCKSVIPHMIKQKSGKIINVSSVCGLTGLANVVPYTCSKFGVIGLTKSLAAELAPYHINVNTICPGAVDTPMLSESAKIIGVTPEEAQEMWGQSTLLNTLWQPQDVSNAVVCLASEDFRFLTGHSLPVDGGWIGLLP
jgi:NAD(P)-dependent dehydrogenase (short-subunit alcohol dehydrogenase family)